MLSDRLRAIAKNLRAVGPLQGIAAELTQEADRAVELEKKLAAHRQVIEAGDTCPPSYDDIPCPHGKGKCVDCWLTMCSIVPARRPPMTDTDFLQFADALWAIAGFSKASRERKLQRFCEGRALYAGTEEDFDSPGYNLLLESLQEGDDKCVYQTWLLFRQSQPQSEQEQEISTLVESALRYQAAAERQTDRAIQIAQNVECQCDESCDATSATSADGRSVPSNMACRCGNWLNGSESDLFDEER